MKYRFLLALPLMFLAAAPDPVVAIRGKDTLTLSQVRALLAAADPATRQRLEANPDALTQLIRDALLQRAILEQANAEHWDQRPEVSALLARVRQTAIVQSYLAVHGAPPASYPSDADIRAAYDANKKQLIQPRTYHLLQAFVPKPAGGSDAAARQTLARVETALGHTQFEEAAKRTPGVQFADLGWVREDRIQEAAKKAVAGLPEGQVSPPVCTDAGCSILKLVATHPAGPPPLEDVRSGLIRLLREQKQRQGEQAVASQFLAKQPVRVDEIQLSQILAK